MILSWKMWGGVEMGEKNPPQIAQFLEGTGTETQLQGSLKCLKSPLYSSQKIPVTNKTASRLG